MPFIGPSPDQPTPEFWALVDLARSDAKAARARVAKLDRAELVSFYWAYHDAAELLRDKLFEDEDQLPSEDGVEDAMVWAVAQGEPVYRDVLTDRRRLPNEVGRFMDLMGEVVVNYQRRFHETIPYPEDLAR
ncbi:MAG: DUF4240 domain-containing protein [Burkholderiaceae bacterium]|nr:DUF4240 domain-containing protein [Burkholderiaceae bacterium]